MDKDGRERCIEREGWRKREDPVGSHIEYKLQYILGAGGVREMGWVRERGGKVTGNINISH